MHFIYAIIVSCSLYFIKIYQINFKLISEKLNNLCNIFNSRLLYYFNYFLLLKNTLSEYQNLLAYKIDISLIT